MKFFKTALLAICLGNAVLAIAQDGVVAGYEKLGVHSQEIVNIAKSGVEQQLLVDVNVLDVTKALAKERDSIEAKAKGTKEKTPELAASSEATADAETQQAAAKFQENIAAAKRKVFELAQQYGVTILRDYPNSGTVLVSITSLEALNAIVRSPYVTAVNPIEQVKISANWPSSYSDISIMNSPVPTAQFTGKGQGLFFFDTPWNEPLIMSSRIGLSSTAGKNAYTAGEWNWPNPLVACTDPSISMCQGTYWLHSTIMQQAALRVAPDAQRGIYQVTDDLGGIATTDWLVAGLDDAIGVVSHSRVPSVRWAAANLSIAISSTQKYSSSCPTVTTASQIGQFIALGVVPVVATGNQGWTDGVNAPSCVPGVLSVGASTDSDTVAYSYSACRDNARHADQVPCFSNRSASYPSVYAPGVWIGDPNAEGPVYGTSFAAPHVAGEVAVLRSNSAGAAKSVSDLIAIIKTSGKSISDGVSSKIRVDVGQALAKLGTSGPPHIIISPTVFTATTGNTHTLVVQYYDGSGSVVLPTPTHAWTSSNSSVVTVDSNDVAHGLTVGDAVLTVHFNDTTATVQAFDAAPAIMGVKISPSVAPPASYSVHLGNTQQFTASGIDQDGNYMPVPNQTWSSTNPAVATVDSTGKLTAVSLGTATLNLKVMTNPQTAWTAYVPISVTRTGIGGPDCKLNPRACK